MKSPLFEGLLGAVRKPPQRRLDQRHPMGIPVTIIADGAARDVQSVDIGLGGVSLRVSAPLAIGARVSLTIPVADPPATLSIAGEVRWQRGDLIGVRFDPPQPRQAWLLHRLWQ